MSSDSNYVHPEVLVSTEWVASHVHDPSIRIIESNEDILLYDTGHKIWSDSALLLKAGQELFAKKLLAIF